MIDGLAVKVPRSIFTCASLFTFTFSLENLLHEYYLADHSVCLVHSPCWQKFPFPAVDFDRLVYPARLHPTYIFISGILSALDSAKGEDSHQTLR